MELMELIRFYTLVVLQFVVLNEDSDMTVIYVT